MNDSAARLLVPVAPPFRLDLTATVLRRLSTNVVDVFDGTTYRRLIGGPASAALLEVEQVAPEMLAVAWSGDSGVDAGALVRRMLGLDVDLRPFSAAAAAFPWLFAIVERARGVKPPRYPTLWEAVVNAVVFQQVSIHAAAAILRRVVERYEPRRQVAGVVLAAFPDAAVLADADPVELRGLGLSINKVVTLRTFARALLAGDVSESALATLPTPELVAALQTAKGIGPWTAAVVALRGFGRLDIFPMKDSGVARSLTELSGDPGIDVSAMLDTLGAQRGMLYYHLLLGRLAARGDIAL